MEVIVDDKTPTDVATLRNLAKQFFSYSNRVYGLWQWLKSVTEGRYYPHVPLKSVLTYFLAGLVCRLRSLNQIEGHTKSFGRTSKTKCGYAGVCTSKDRHRGA